MSASNSIPAETMRAAHLTGAMQLEVRQIPVPQPPPGGALMKVHAIGLCGSDINRIRHTTSDEVRVLGHEVVGEIVSIDNNSVDFQPGERLAIGHVHVPCMHCVYCRHGAPAMCRHFKSIRIEPGGYAEYIALTSDHLAHSALRLPEHVSNDAATFIDPLACCLRAVRSTEVEAFDRVVVVGAGIMGLLFVQLLREMQAECYVVDISSHRLEVARKFGAQHTTDASGQTLVEEILARTEHQGSDVVLFTYLNQSILDDGMGYARDGSRLCVFAPPIETLNLNLNFFDFFRREMRMSSSYSSTLLDLENALQWIASGRVDVEAMVTGRTDLEGLLDTVKTLDDTQLKIIVEP